MSDAATRILEQLQTQNDLRMQAAYDIARAAASRVNAENALTEAGPRKRPRLPTPSRRAESSRNSTSSGALLVYWRRCPRFMW